MGAAGQPGQFFFSSLSVQRFHIGKGSTFFFLFSNSVVAVRHRRDLGQVRHAKNLTTLRETAHFFRHFSSGPTTDAGVYLVKDKGHNLIVFR